MCVISQSASILTHSFNLVLPRSTFSALFRPGQSRKHSSIPSVADVIVRPTKSQDEISMTQQFSNAGVLVYPTCFCVGSTGARSAEEGIFYKPSRQIPVNTHNQAKHTSTNAKKQMKKRLFLLSHIILGDKSTEVVRGYLPLR